MALPPIVSNFMIWPGDQVTLAKLHIGHEAYPSAARFFPDQGGDDDQDSV